MIHFEIVHTHFDTSHSMFTQYDTVHTHFEIVQTHFDASHSMFMTQFTHTLVNSSHIVNKL